MLTWESGKLPGPPSGRHGINLPEASRLRACRSNASRGSRALPTRRGNQAWPL